MLISSVSQAQTQGLSASGNSEVTVADAAEIFGIGAREIVIDGTLDLELDTLETGLFGFVDGDLFGGFFGSFDALTENSSAVSIDLQNESGAVIGTLTSSTLTRFSFVTLGFMLEPEREEFSAVFTFENVVFTSTDASTAGIAVDRFTITTTDRDFPGEAGIDPERGIIPDDFFANVTNGSFRIDESKLEIVFTNDGTSFNVDTVGILQSDPNQQFSLFPISTLLGDINLDGQVNFLDISPFISVLTSGDFQAEADLNEDGLVNFLDIGLLILVFPGA